MSAEYQIVCGCFGTIYLAKPLKNGLMSNVGRKDVTHEAVVAVMDHIMLMDKYDENGGFAGYNFKKKDGGHVAIVVYDTDKYEIAEKEGGAN